MRTVAGLRVQQACGAFLLPGFGVSSSSPQVPRDQPICATQTLIMKFCYNKVIFHIFYYYWGKNIVHYTEDLVIQRFVN